MPTPKKPVPIRDRVTVLRGKPDPSGVTAPRRQSNPVERRLTVVVQGAPKAGKTTLAGIIEHALKSAGAVAVNRDADVRLMHRSAISAGPTALQYTHVTILTENIVQHSHDVSPAPDKQARHLLRMILQSGALVSPQLHTQVEQLIGKA